jgi:branched-chain amino acid transport system ATP-binding protein
LLNISKVHASYGPVLALQGVSLEVPRGKIVAVLGANGAGKSSILRAISGLLRPSQGAIELEGHRIDRMPPEAIIRMGISQVPEGRQLFAGFTVMDNLRLGAYLRRDSGGIRRDLERVFTYFPVLAERQRQAAGLLSGGEQQMLAIGRALMANPRILLLDEPSLGLAPLIVREIMGIIRLFNENEGLTILLVEQNANMALTVAHYCYLLETGLVAVHGDAAHLRLDPSVRRTYLGDTGGAETIVIRRR